MKTQDVLADHMQIGWPETIEVFAIGIGVSGSRDVIRQRIQPDIHDVLIIFWNRNTPLEAGARDREVSEARLDEADNLIAPRGRSNEVRMLLVIFQQRFLPFRQVEEIARLLDPLDRCTGRCFSILDLGLGKECFIPNRVPAFIGTQIDMAFIQKPFP